MINEKASLLLEKVIKEKYSNIRLDNKVFNDEDFYYEFKSDDKISENDFENIEKRINEIDNGCFVKLLRICLL